MARERTADDSTTANGGASGGASLLDRGAYRRLATVATAAVADSDDGRTDASGATAGVGRTEATETTEALDSNTAAGDD